MHRIDGPGVAPGGLFREGNPATGTPATTVTDDWCNALQEELVNVILGAGILLNKADNTQLKQAILALIGSTVPAASITVAGKVELADTTEARALADAVRAITPFTLAEAFKGTNQSLGDNGYQRLPGGLIVQWGSAQVNSGDTIAFPLAFPLACRRVIPQQIQSSGTVYGVSSGSRTSTGFVAYHGHTNPITIGFIAVGS